VVHPRGTETSCFVLTGRSIERCSGLIDDLAVYECMIPMFTYTMLLPLFRGQDILARSQELELIDIHL